MTTAAEIIDGLGGNPATGMCKCPAHDDKRPSLRVSEADGRVLVKCFAGCSQEAVIDALRQLSLWASRSSVRPDRQERERRRREQKEQKKREKESLEERQIRAWRIVRAALLSERKPTSYLAGRGIETAPPAAMLMSAADSKRLTGWRSPAMVLPIITNGHLLTGAHVTWLSADAKTKLALRDGSKPKRMYGVAAGGYTQLSDIDPNRPLVVGEGPESVMSAMQVTGLPGIATLTTSSTPFAIPECSEIIVAADNDEPGQHWARRAAEQWAAAGHVVRIATPRGDGEDWNDVLVDGSMSVAGMREALLKAPIVKPPDHVGSVGVAEFMGLQFPPRKYLLRPWLTTTGLCMIDAKPGHGKTWLALGIGHAVARGDDFLGWKCEHAGRVLYVDGELPGELLQRRLGMLVGAATVPRFNVLSRAQFELAGKNMVDLGTAEGRAVLDVVIERGAFDLIILDSVLTLVRTGVNNDVESWREVQDWSLKHRGRGRAVIFLHHQGKGGSQLGTVGREIVLDTRLTMRDDPDLATDDASAFRIEFSKGRDLFGADRAPITAFLSTSAGVVEWRAEPVCDEKAERRERVREMVSEGKSTGEIAKEVGISKGRVSQIRKQVEKTWVERAADRAEQRAEGPHAASRSSDKGPREDLGV